MPIVASTAAVDGVATLRVLPPPLLDEVCFNQSDPTLEPPYRTFAR
jgi:hypothetical protein